MCTVESTENGKQLPKLNNGGLILLSLYLTIVLLVLSETFESILFQLFDDWHEIVNKEHHVSFLNVLLHDLYEIGSTVLSITQTVEIELCQP